MQQLYTLDEVAALLQVTTRQVRRWRSLGLIQVVCLAGSRKYPRVSASSLEKFLSISNSNSNSNRKRQRTKTP